MVDCVRHADQDGAFWSAGLCPQLSCPTELDIAGMVVPRLWDAAKEDRVNCPEFMEDNCGAWKDVDSTESGM